MNRFLRKRHRRLVWLLTVVVLVGAIATGFFVVRKQQMHERARQYKPQAIEAYEQGEYESAGNLLAAYLQHYDEDAEALRYFARARREQAEREGEGFDQAIAGLRRLIHVEPEDLEARIELVRLYERVGYVTEMLSAAEDVLERDPDNLEIIEIKIEALAFLRRFPEALETIRAVHEQDPTQLNLHLRALELLSRADRPRSEIVDYAEQWRQEHPEDPRFLLVHGRALQLTDASEEAARLYAQAAADPIEEPDFVRELARRLDGTGQYEEAASLLEHMADEQVSPAMTRMHAERLWQAGRIDPLLERLSELDPAAPETDPRLAAMLALGQHAAQEAEEVEQTLEQMASQPESPEAELWAALLEKVLLEQNAEADEILALAQRLAQNLSEPSAQLHYLIGNAHARVDQRQRAIDAWHEAIRIAPAWSTPYTRVSEVMREMDQPEEAVRYAQTALERAPQSLPAATAYVLGAAALGPPTISEDDLLFATNEIQRAAPLEPRTLPLYMRLLLQAEQMDEANRVLDEVLEADPPLAAGLLTRLAQAALEAQWNRVDELVDHAQQAHGMTPSLARSLAIAEFRQADEPQAGRAAFEAAREQASQPQAAGWDLAQAMLLEEIGHEDRESVWRQVAADHPDNVSVQQAVLEAGSVQDQRELIAQSVNRLRELTGDENTEWRVARARLLMTDDDASRESLAQAAILLNEVIDRAANHVQARLMLANCLERLGNLDGAIEQAEAAARIQPGTPEIGLRLAGLYQQRGDFDRAREQLNRHAGRSTLSQGQRRHVAALLGAQGDPRGALEALGGDRASLDVVPESEKYLQARLHWQQGEVDRAEQLLEELLQAEVDQPWTVSLHTFAADFFASTGRVDRALQVLQRLSQRDDLSPGLASMILADFHQRGGRIDSARELYQQATGEAPGNPTVWQRYVAFLLRLGDFDAAYAAVERARQVDPDAPTWQALVEHEQAIRTAGALPRLRPVTAAIVESADDREAAVATIRLIDRAMSRDMSLEALLPDLRQLSNRHPRFLALQVMIAETFHLAGEYEEAVRIARRAAGAFPNASEPLALLATTLEAGEQWWDLLGAAEEWRHRAPHEAEQADRALAVAHLELNQPDRARQVLEPHASGTIPDSELQRQMFGLYLAALLQTGHTDEAYQQVSPLLADSEQWRRTARNLTLRAARDRDHAVRWLELIAPHVPEDAVDEQLDVANAMALVSREFQAPELRERAHEHIQALSERDDATPMVHFQLGVLAELEEDTEQAIRHYEAALETDSEFADAMNNLARILARQERDLERAATLADRSLELQPELPLFHDTRALVNASRGDFEAALESVRRAVELDADNVRWHVTRVWVLVKANREQEAVEVFDDVRLALPPDEAQLPAVTRQQLQHIHQSLGERAGGSVSRQAQPAGHSDEFVTTEHQRNWLAIWGFTGWSMAQVHVY